MDVTELFVSVWTGGSALSSLFLLVCVFLGVHTTLVHSCCCALQVVRPSRLFMDVSDELFPEWLVLWRFLCTVSVQR